MEREREREREIGLEGSSRGVCGVEVVWVAVLSREQCDPPLQESQGAQGAEKGEQLAERAPQCNLQPFFFFFKGNAIYLFIYFGCVGSSFLCEGFL